MMDGCGKFGGDNAYSNEKLLGRVSAESVTPCLPSERILDMSRDYLNDLNNDPPG
jgi:hypothetical protein